MAKKYIFLIMIMIMISTAGFTMTKSVEYKIGPEDQIKIFVDRHEELTTSMPVGPDGYISFPLLGNIKVSGYSRDELKNEIASKLSKYLKNPIVSVVIEEYNSYKVAVLGEVENPGLYIMRSDPTVMHAMSMAGGPKETASLDEAYLKRAGSDDLIKLNLYELLVKGDMSKDLTLSPGDVIYVPQGTKNQIYVLGEVKNPGVYRMKEGITLLEAIGQAGSETDKAKLQRTSVIRKTKNNLDPDVYIVDVMKILREGKMKYNLRLEPGDIVYVPKSVKPQWDRILPMLNTISITHDLTKNW